MRRGRIGLAFGICVLSATGVVQAQATPGFVNFNYAFSAAYGFQFPNAVAANGLAFAAQPAINNQFAQREAAMDRQQGAVGEEELDQLPGFDELDATTISERDRFARGRGRSVRATSRRAMALTVKNGAPMQFYNRSTAAFYPEAAAGSHKNSYTGSRRTSSGGGFGGFGGGIGVGGIGVF